MPATYLLDTTGLSPANLVSDEVHVLTEVNASTYRILIPVFAPFYLDNFTLKHVDILGVQTTLIPDVDYYFTLPYIGGSRSIGKMLYGAVSINTMLLDGLIKITYQTLGGEWSADAGYVRARLAEMLYNPRTTIWDIVTDKPNQFPPTEHAQDFDTFYGQRELIESINALSLQIAGTPSSTIPVIAHLVDQSSNPHRVTKDQVGLGSVLNLPVAQDDEVRDKLAVDKYVTLRQLVENPIVDPEGNIGSATRLETPRQINGVAFDGTQNITINAIDPTPRIAVSEKGMANGVATLDAGGLIPASQLPSYLDDVLEFATLSAFPSPGALGRIYVAVDTSKAYRWSGSSYISMAVGNVDSVAGKTGVVTLTKADVGLNLVVNAEVASSLEVINKIAVPKYVMLDQVLYLIDSNTVPPPPVQNTRQSILTATSYYFMR